MKFINHTAEKPVFDEIDQKIYSSITMSERYKEVVDDIKGLNWEALQVESLQKLMYVSYAAAREFAEALELALLEYPKDARLKEMAEGELQTDNLQYADYTTWGDHADFLKHFLEKAGFVPGAALEEAFQTYLLECRSLSAPTRAMTVFSREQELSGIFQNILKNEHWKGETLQAFRYYLEQHIALDGAANGHGELVRHHPVDDSVLRFYQVRLDFYRLIPELFSTDRQQS